MQGKHPKRLLRTLKNKYLSSRNPLVPVITFKNYSVDDKFNSIIPRICHQTWEEKYFRLGFASGIEEFHHSNQDFTFILYDANDRSDYMNSGIWRNTEISKIYNRSKFGVLDADIFSYCVLYERGGFYIDLARKLPDPLINYFQSKSSLSIFFANHQSSQDLISIQCNSTQLRNNLPIGRSVSHSFMAYKKEHPIMLSTIENICEMFPFTSSYKQSNPRASIINLTGPGALTRAVWNFALTNQLDVKDIHLVDSTKSQFNIKGSHLRYLDYPYYGLQTNQAIFSE